MDTRLIINPAKDPNAAINMMAHYTPPGLLLLIYINIETLPQDRLFPLNHFIFILKYDS